MRLRKQREVARENEFYMELLHQALPKECLTPSLPPPPAPSLPIDQSTVVSNGSTLTTHLLPNGNHHQSNGTTIHCRKPSSSSTTAICNNGLDVKPVPITNGSVSTNGVSNSPKLNKSEYDDAKKNALQTVNVDKHELQYLEHPIIKTSVSSVNDFDDSDASSGKNSFKNPITTSLSLMSPKGSSYANPQTISTSTPSKWSQSSCNLNSPTVTNGTNSSNMNGSSKKHNKNMVTNNLATPKDDLIILKLEADIKRLKADLQGSRQTEQELRSQINSLTSDDRGSKAEISQLLQDNENLQTKLHNLVTARQQDKQNINLLEKKILEEKKNKASLETQLSTERKAKKDVEVASANRTLAIAAAARTGDCTENCKAKRRELDNDLKQLKRELKLREEQLRQLDREAQVCFITPISIKC